MHTSRTNRIRKALPYALLLTGAGYFYHLATGFDFIAPGGRIGPDFWPKAVLGLLIASCAYALVKIVFFDRSPPDLSGVLQDIMQAAPAEKSQAAEEAGPFPQLLAAGIVLTVAYVFLIDKLGFFLCTFLYLAAFMYVGRYRRLGVIIATAFLGSLAFVFVFMKVVYVSLPLGEAPFASVSLLLMHLLGIR
jgi:putative tricarboxylic transport membrane protein